MISLIHQLRLSLRYHVSWVLVRKGPSCSSGNHLSIQCEEEKPLCFASPARLLSIFVIGFHDESEAAVGTDVLKIKRGRNEGPEKAYKQGAGLYC